MNSRFLKVIWVLLAVGVVVFGVLSTPTITVSENEQTVIAPTLWIIPAVVIVVGVTALTLFTTIRPALLRLPLERLREHPNLYWFMLLVYLCLAVGWWVYKAQPTNGRGLTAVEFCYLCCCGWLLVWLLGYDMTTAKARAMGSKLGQSKLTGVLVTLTTILLLFWGAEAYLRVFYITTDGYGFTAMNYWWYENFYKKNLNSLGYRDYEPMPDEAGLTRVAVVGDSFTAGHGISNIDDTYPQVLERELGAGYDVNLIAQSGWDSIDFPAWIDAYYQNIAPRSPQIVVLSYYINDIDYLLTNEQDPNTAFDFLDLNSPAGWFVLNFFVPNYVYYNIAQFTSPVRNTNFTDRLIRAHQDDAIWAQHEPNLEAFYAWTEAHDAKLVVLLWPQLAAIRESQPALERVRAFFENKPDVVIADLSPALEGKPTLELLVNRFDSHPSVEANRLAADLLAGVIREMQ